MSSMSVPELIESLRTAPQIAAESATCAADVIEGLRETLSKHERLWRESDAKQAKQIEKLEVELASVSPAVSDLDAAWRAATKVKNARISMLERERDNMKAASDVFLTRAVKAEAELAEFKARFTLKDGDTLIIKRAGAPDPDPRIERLQQDLRKEQLKGNEFRRDAFRYRWLKANRHSNWYAKWFLFDDDKFDTAVDAERFR